MSSHFTKSTALYVSVVMTTGQRLSGSLDWHHSVVLLSSVTRSVACPVLSQLPLCLPSPRTVSCQAPCIFLLSWQRSPPLPPPSPFLNQGALKTHVNAEVVLSQTSTFLKSHRYTQFICGHHHDPKHTLPGGERPLYSDPEQNHPKSEVRQAKSPDPQATVTGACFKHVGPGLDSEGRNRARVSS